jgi:thiol:disulfide interchange protein
MNFATTLLLVAAITTGNGEPTDYKNAYEKAMKGDKPLLVLVTADWCGPCQTMKQTTIPELLAQNKFKDFHYATVDWDRDGELAQQLIQGRGVPQLIIFEKKDDKWQRRYLTGIKTVATVEAFLQKSEGIRTAKADN